MVEINNNMTRAEQLIESNRKQRARAEELIRKRAVIAGTPEVTNRMAKSISDQRRDIMELQLEAGEFREGNSGWDPMPRDGNNSEKPIKMVQTHMGVISHNGKGLYKMASGTSTGNVSGMSSGWRGSNDSTRQIPEVYSPLWLNSNLNLPRDRPTINAWSRSFFALNPIVHNAITLHSTYPIAKLNIKSKNPKVEKFFSQMIEEIDLMNMAVLAAQEFWILGEAFIYGELDEAAGKWSRLMILNPDYVNVQRSVIAAEPIISLRPDENLRRVVTGNQPSDLQQRKQLDPSIIEHVRRNENIPLNNFYVHHMARRISPYEIRGTGLVVSCFRALMLWDKLRECYGADTEVLTSEGFKKIIDIIEIKEEYTPDRLKTVGVEYDDSGNVIGVIGLKSGVRVACFNPDTEELEYHEPEELHMSNYKGKMVHFSGKKVDVLVTPNHKMLAKLSSGNWEKIPAQDLLEKKSWRFRSHAKWTGKKIETVEVCGKDVPADLYLKALGFIISEGCIYREESRYAEIVSISQLTQSMFCEDMRETINVFADKIGKNCSNKICITGAGYSKETPKEIWSCKIHGRDLTQHLMTNIGDGESANSHNKHLPRWVMDLCPEQLQILLNALLAGDGSVNESKYGTKSKNFVYNTVSKQLANDVYEIVFKCGYSPNFNIHTSKKTDGRLVTEYRVLWSDTNYGREPIVHTWENTPGKGGGASVTQEDYDGIVWCLGVPTGLFVTRHNGKISIQGNSKYAQADNMVNPLTLIKIGNQEFRPSPVDLEHWRNVFEECYDEETEVLTDQGFRRFDEVVSYEQVMDGTYSVPYYASRTKQNIKIACFNQETETLEYHEPSRSVVYDHDGEMIRFNARNMDICVTPGHDMLVKPEKKNEWSKVKAEKLLQGNYRTRAILNFVGETSEFIEVLGKKVPTELYLKFLGYLLSEGSVESRKYEYTSISEICFTQSVNSDCIDDIRKTVNDFCAIFEIRVLERERIPSGDFYRNTPSNVVHFHIRNKKLVQYFQDRIYFGDDRGAKTKIIPRDLLQLDPALLKVLLSSLVAGDGSIIKNRESTSYKYYTSSKTLANDVQEIVLKCGYSSNIIERSRTKTYKGKQARAGERYLSTEYIVSWSDAQDGQYPAIAGKTSKEYYKGKVWCFTVPTGLFVTRRNGKITIQGNSQYDKDFKIFTHDAVTVERVGYGQGIYDTSADVEQLIKEIYIGLMVPSVIMDGSDTTYATGSVALDVLRQRYMQFRQMMTSWLKRKIFAPISQIQEFYEYVDGEKTLIVPEVDWNHMSLFDMDSYINNMVNLSQGEGVQKRVSLQTLYRSLGLEYEEEQRKIRHEDIQDAIRTREIAAMARYSIHELRALGPGDEIDEVADEPVLGQSPYEPAADAGAAPGGPMGGPPPLGGPKPGGAPPPAPIGGGGFKPPGGPPAPPP